jgi:type IV pilus assembly protein PilC
MPIYKFSGVDASGSKVAGERDAVNKQVLQATLRKERIANIVVKEKGKEFTLPTLGSGKVPVKDIAIFFRQFSVMIDAGLPLVQCLEILAANQENPAFQKSLTGVRITVEGGSTLSNAMRQYPKVFDDLTTNMVEAGETGGILDVILQRLAAYVEKAVKLKSAVKSALIYPVSVISIAVLVVGGLLKFVVPIFEKLFAGLGVDLPLPTRLVIALSQFVGNFWWVAIIGLIALIFGIKQVRKDRKGKYFTDNILLKLPVVGVLLRKIAVARFTRTLGTLITSGVPILEGLAITARTSGNAVLEEA